MKCACFYVVVKCILGTNQNKAWTESSLQIDKHCIAFTNKFNMHSWLFIVIIVDVVVVVIIIIIITLIIITV